MSLRRALLLALAPLTGALIAIVASFGASAIAPAPASVKLRTTAVGVGLREYRIALYRSRVLPGRVRLNIQNFGEDGHDVQMSGPSNSTAIRGTSPEVDPGARGTLMVTLRARGEYRLICTIGDHAQRGMLARLRVVKKLA